MVNTPAAERTPLVVIWEDPPEIPKKTMFSEIVEQLKMRPNTWARIRTSKTSSGAYSTRKSLQGAANGGTIETRFVPHEDGKQVHVYARYVPKGRT